MLGGIFHSIATTPHQSDGEQRLNKMTAMDWQWLTTVSEGTPQTVVPEGCRKKLAEMQYIVARYHASSVIITGLGQEALRRRHFKLGPPKIELDDCAMLPDTIEEQEAPASPD